MRNPYTGEVVHHDRPPGRRRFDYAFAGLLVLGVAYLVTYTWAWWDWNPYFVVSAQAVGFVYLVVGGWGFLRSRRHRLHGDAGTNAMLAWIAVPVAVWDIASPFVIGDVEWFVVPVHVVGGAVALALALWAVVRGGKEPSEERHGVGLT